jgi:hypothetical protein
MAIAATNICSSPFAAKLRPSDYSDQHLFLPAPQFSHARTLCYISMEGAIERCLAFLRPCQSDGDVAATVSYRR